MKRKLFVLIERVYVRLLTRVLLPVARRLPGERLRYRAMVGSWVLANWIHFRACEYCIEARKNSVGAENSWDQG